MSSNIRVGQKVRVSIRFIDFDRGAGTDDLLDPSSVSVALYKYDITTSAYILQASDLGPVVRESLGVYYYDWTTPDDGLFKLLFVATLADATPSTIENARNFFVGTAEPSSTLGLNKDIYFLTELDPIYIDPTIILGYYATADLVEVTEIIYRLSTQLQTWFGENVVITPLMEEWLTATVMCELTRIYIFDGGMDGFSNDGAFTLGDLTVSESIGSAAGSKKLNRGNVDTWCELASLLRNELMFSRNGIKAVIRGSNYCNPIPPRHLKNAENPYPRRRW